MTALTTLDQMKNNRSLFIILSQKVRNLRDAKQNGVSFKEAKQGAQNVIDDMLYNRKTREGLVCWSCQLDMEIAVNARSWSMFIECMNEAYKGAREALIKCKETCKELQAIEEQQQASEAREALANHTNQQMEEASDALPVTATHYSVTFRAFQKVVNGETFHFNRFLEEWVIVFDFDQVENKVITIEAFKNEAARRRRLPSVGMFYSWVNDFISVAGFASYYDVSEAEARSMIARSRVLAMSAYAGNRSQFTAMHDSDCHPYRAQTMTRQLLDEHSA